MTGQERVTRAHRITPSMLQQSERNDRSFHRPADLYKLSSCANGPEELLSDCAFRKMLIRSIADLDIQTCR